MFRLAVFALTVAAASASLVAVVPKYHDNNAVAPRGAVGGISNCGSQGQILEVRVTDCTNLPCEAIIGRTYTVEADFIPVASHSVLNVYVGVIAGGQEIQVINQNLAAEITGGKSYTLEFPWKIEGGIASGVVALRIRLSGDGVTELCGLATANIHA